MRTKGDRFKIVLVAGLALGWCACGQKSPPAASRSAAERGLAGATGATANLAPNDPPGEWRRQARDYANTRYSPLGQINAPTSAG